MVVELDVIDHGVIGMARIVDDEPREDRKG
jgi:hypothetical protein